MSRIKFLDINESNKLTRTFSEDIVVHNFNSFHDTKIQDELFCGSVTDQKENITGVLRDWTYGHPDKETYIFSVGDDDYYVLYSSNFIAPIRKKVDLLYRTPALLRRLSKNPSAKSMEGVYIMEIYGLHRCTVRGSVVDNHLESIISYYSNNSGIYDNNNVIADYIRNNLSILNKNNSSYSEKETVKIRIVTFIPASELKEHKILNIPASGVVIGLGEVLSNIAHPSSSEYRKNGYRLYSDSKNSVEIDIFEQNPSRPYYINIGNKILALEASPNVNSSMNMASITTYHNRVPLEREEANIEDLESLGIFTSKEAASVNGDAKIHYELLKLKADIEKEIKHYELLQKKFKVEESKLKNDLLISDSKVAIANVDYQKTLLDLHKAHKANISSDDTKSTKDKLESMQKFLSIASSVKAIL